MRTIGVVYKKTPSRTIQEIGVLIDGTIISPILLSRHVPVGEERVRNIRVGFAEVKLVVRNKDTVKSIIREVLVPRSYMIAVLRENRDGVFEVVWGKGSVSVVWEERIVGGGLKERYLVQYFTYDDLRVPINRRLTDIIVSREV